MPAAYQGARFAAACTTTPSSHTAVKQKETKPAAGPGGCQTTSPRGLQCCPGITCPGPATTKTPTRPTEQDRHRERQAASGRPNEQAQHAAGQEAATDGCREGRIMGVKKFKRSFSFLAAAMPCQRLGVTPTPRHWQSIRPTELQAQPKNCSGTPYNRTRQLAQSLSPAALR